MGAITLRARTTVLKRRAVALRAISLRAWPTILEWRAITLWARWAWGAIAVGTFNAIAEIIVARTGVIGTLLAKGRTRATRSTGSRMRCIGTHWAAKRFAFRLEAARFRTTCTRAGATTATARAIFANVIEATQFTSLVIDCAIYVIVLHAVFADTNFGWTRFALSNNRLQGQNGCILFKFKFCTQGFDICLVHLDAIAALQ